MTTSALSSPPLFHRKHPFSLVNSGDEALEWRQLKAYEIAGQMFDNEYDWALAIIQGVEHRAQLAGFILERFKFISA